MAACDNCPQLDDETAVNIFSVNNGCVVAVDGVGVPIYISVDGMQAQNKFHNLKAIMTGLGYQAQSGHQFMHAFREFIYVYVFTERIGDITISGLAFPCTCNFSGIGPQGPQDTIDGSNTITGLEYVIGFYEANRITSRSDPLVIGLGIDTSKFYKCFLVGMRAEVVNAEVGMAQFSYSFKMVPNISDDDDFCYVDTCPDLLQNVCT